MTETWMSTCELNSPRRVEFMSAAGYLRRANDSLSIDLRRIPDLTTAPGGIFMFCISESATRASALCTAVLVGLVFTGVGRAAPNPTCTVQVVAPQSIQDAIDGAAPGATVCVGPGTYQENLLI